MSQTNTRFGNAHSHFNLGGAFASVLLKAPFLVFKILHRNVWITKGLLKDFKLPLMNFATPKQNTDTVMIYFVSG